MKELISAISIGLMMGACSVDALRASAPAGLVWFYEPMPEQHHDTIYRGRA